MMQENEKEANNMPTVKDKATGEVISRQRYNEKGIQNAASIADSNPSWEIDYAPGGENNAPDMRESYQLGGKIPGQLGFGERPMVRPLGQNPIINQPSQRPVVNPLGKNPIIKSSLSPIMEEGGKIPKYKKGGKAKK